MKAPTTANQVREAVGAQRRRLKQNHPIYAARDSKEHPLLEDLIVGDVQMAAYIADLKHELEVAHQPDHSTTTSNAAIERKERTKL